MPLGWTVYLSLQGTRNRIKDWLISACVSSLIANHLFSSTLFIILCDYFIWAFDNENSFIDISSSSWRSEAVDELRSFPGAEPHVLQDCWPFVSFELRFVVRSPRCLYPRRMSVVVGNSPPRSSRMISIVVRAMVVSNGVEPVEYRRWGNCTMDG